MNYGEIKLETDSISALTDSSGNELEGLYLLRLAKWVHLLDEDKWVKLDAPLVEGGVVREVEPHTEGAMRIILHDTSEEFFNPHHHWFVPLEEGQRNEF